MQPIIYVAGPYRGPDRAAIAANIDAARRLALYACTLGWFPICPHTNTAHMDADLPNLGDEFWLRGTLELMERCDAVVLVDGWERSAGTLGEIARADTMRLPVFRSSDLLPSAAEFIDYLFAKEGEMA
jgi:hypothetical protein